MHMTYLKLTSSIIFYSGLIIVMVSLLYMIINLSEADNFIDIWKTFMIIGVAFTFIGSFTKMIKLKDASNLF